MILISIFIAILAVVYRCILAYEPILNWWFVFGRKFDKYFFYKPIWGCEKCFAGQIAFWTYVLNWFAHSETYRNHVFNDFLFRIIQNYGSIQYSVLNGLFFVTFTILVANVLSKVYEIYIK